MEDYPTGKFSEMVVAFIVGLGGTLCAGRGVVKGDGGVVETSACLVIMVPAKRPLGLAASRTVQHKRPRSRPHGNWMTGRIFLLWRKGGLAVALGLFAAFALDLIVFYSADSH